MREETVMAAGVTRPSTAWVAFASAGMLVMSLLTAASWMTSLGDEDGWYHSIYVKYGMLSLFILAWGLHIIEEIK